MAKIAEPERIQPVARWSPLMHRTTVSTGIGELTHSWLIPDRAIVPLSRALVEGALTVTAFDERDARQLEPGNMWGRVAFSTFSWSSLGYSLQSTGPSSASSQRVMRVMRCLVTELVTG